jgi:hypothetical protein
MHGLLAKIFTGKKRKKKTPFSINSWTECVDRIHLFLSKIRRLFSFNGCSAKWNRILRWVHHWKFISYNCSEEVNFSKFLANYANYNKLRKILANAPISNKLHKNYTKYARITQIRQISKQTKHNTIICKFYDWNSF